MRQHLAIPAIAFLMIATLADPKVTTAILAVVQHPTPQGVVTLVSAIAAATFLYVADPIGKGVSNE